VSLNGLGAKKNLLAVNRESQRNFDSDSGLGESRELKAELGDWQMEASS
jgi:hypothetical protein